MARYELTFAEIANSDVGIAKLFLTEWVRTKPKGPIEDFAKTFSITHQVNVKCKYAEEFYVIIDILDKRDLLYQIQYSGLRYNLNDNFDTLD